MDWVRQLTGAPLFVLFAIITLGRVVGEARIGALSLGATGVFFVGLAAGRAGVQIPPALTELGLVLFVYSVGLQAGPHFFRLLRVRGLAFVSIGAGAALCGGAAALGLATWLDVPRAVAAGLFCGATTCTPALAAVVEALRALPVDQQALAAIGYGVAYPASVLGVVLVIQTLGWVAPRLGLAAQSAPAGESPPLESRIYHVTNPNCDGLTIATLAGRRLSRAVFSRVKHGTAIEAARGSTVVRLGSFVMAVGEPGELDKLETVLGAPVSEPMDDAARSVVSEALVVSRRESVGRSLRELGVARDFGVVVTRVRREGIEFAPNAEFELELGDVLRVVGSPEHISQLAERVGRQERRLDETTLLPFAAGLALGVAVGMAPIPIPGGAVLRLGAGGGAFLVALLLGAAHRVGPVSVYVPAAARYLMRELGLLIFLTGVGAAAGAGFFSVFEESGLRLLLAGACITAVTLLAAMLLTLVAFRWGYLPAAGAMAACMTNPPGLESAQRLSPSDTPALAFASVYPVALIAKIIVAQLLLALL